MKTNNNLCNSQCHQQEIVGFDIAVDDVARVQMRNDVQDLACEMHHQAFMHNFSRRLTDFVVDV